MVGIQNKKNITSHVEVHIILTSCLMSTQSCFFSSFCCRSLVMNLPGVHIFQHDYMLFGYTAMIYGISLKGGKFCDFLLLQWAMKLFQNGFIS